MKILNGQDIADFVKERQLHQARGLRQAHNIVPHLAIIRTNPAPVVDSYMKLKREYGADIMVNVTVHTVQQSEAAALIKRLNADSSVHGIIVQIPLPNPSQTQEILDAVDPHKDVDGLHGSPLLDAPTPTAINWLLAGYNIELKDKTIVIVGQGRLVGKPLARMWRDSGYDVHTADLTTDNLPALTLSADVLVTATGSPALIKSNMVKIGAVVVDAGVATDKNGLVGDVAPDVRARNDIAITPEKGGVGPLTVCALFDNVLRVARTTITAE